MPAEFKTFGRTWETLHPGWQMKLWTERNLPPLLNRWAFTHSATQSGRANVLRYELLFRFGGVYIDTDFECLRNLEPLIRNVDCFAGVYGQGEFEHGRFALINNAIMGSVPGHPLLRDLVEEVEANFRSLMDVTPLQAQLTGPQFLTYTLLRHPEVKLFPPRCFYPYGPRERWRRHERFPRAYAVHHWTLNGLSVFDGGARRFGNGRRPCLTVALFPTANSDPLRLQWVLEGLCAQNVADFEVLAFAGDKTNRLEALFRRYRSRLRLRLLPWPRTIRNGNAAARLRNAALRAARAPRILFLDSDCLPDRDVVARHAVHMDRAVTVYGFRRVYPAKFLFPFRDALDYAAIRFHSPAESNDNDVGPRRETWRELRAFCFSAPVVTLRAVGGFDETARSAEVRKSAQRLDAANCPALPCLYGSTVTWLGPRRRQGRSTTLPFYQRNWSGLLE